MNQTRKLVYLALIICLQVILNQFLGLTLPTMRFSFTFLAMALAGYLYGWKFSMLAAIIGDLIGIWLFPKGPFFIGFTIASAASGLFYGLLYDKKNLLKWSIIANVLVNVIAHLLINSYSLTFITSAPLSAFIVPRLIKMLIELPFNIYLTYVFLKLPFVQKLKLRFQS